MVRPSSDQQEAMVCFSSQAQEEPHSLFQSWAPFLPRPSGAQPEAKPSMSLRGWQKPGSQKPGRWALRVNVGRFPPTSRGAWCRVCHWGFMFPHSHFP